MPGVPEKSGCRQKASGRKLWWAQVGTWNLTVFWTPDLCSLYISLQYRHKVSMNMKCPKNPPGTKLSGTKMCIVRCLCKKQHKGKAQIYRGSDLQEINPNPEYRWTMVSNNGMFGKRKESITGRCTAGMEPESLTEDSHTLFLRLQLKAFWSPFLQGRCKPLISPMDKS